MRSAISIFFQKHWDALLAVISVSIFIFLFTRHNGIGISPDSVSYYSAATNIRQHFSFSDFNGLPLVNFPVGYPVFLAVCSFITGVAPLSVAPVVNAVLFSGVILLTSIILSGYKKSNAFYKLLFLSVLACSPALLEVYNMLWSETLFIFLSLLFCLSARYYFITHSYPRLLLLACIAAMAFVTRYAGISLILTGAALLFFDGALPLRKKIAQIFLFGMVSASLATINLIHNHLATASLTGVREKALRSVMDNIVQVGDVIAEWLPFLKMQANTGAVFFMVIFAGAVCIIIFRILQQQYYHSYETIITGFFVSYILFIITVASISRFEDLGNRLLSPAYIPLLLVATSWIPYMLKRSTIVKRTLLLSASLLLWAAMHYHQYQQNAAAWEGIKDAGMPGYAEDSWQTSPTIHYIRLHKKELSPILYSDANDAVFFLTGLHAMPLPHKEIQNEIKGLLNEPDFSVLWLNDGFNEDLVSIDLIKRYKKLVRVTELEDGAIYHFADSTGIAPR